MLRFRSRVLRFRDLGASFSRFGCSFVFEFWVLRASVFVFECFVFETTRFRVLRFRNYLTDYKCGIGIWSISVFANFSYGIAVLGTLECALQHA